MNNFVPSMSIPLYRIGGCIALCVLSSFVIGYVFLYGLVGYIFFESGIYGYRKYQHQQNFGRLKTHGLTVAWAHLKYLHSTMEYSNFLTNYEHHLNDASWRRECAEILQTSNFWCISDFIDTSYKLRWKLDLLFPHGWSENDQLAMLVVLITGLPDSQSWYISKNVSGVTIETCVYDSSCIVTMLEEAPVESLEFWSIFNNDLIWLLNNCWQFKPPVFTQEILSCIHLNRMAKFSLPNDNYLIVTSNATELKVESFDKSAHRGEVMFYNDEFEFWSVWRYALQDIIYFPGH